MTSAPPTRAEILAEPAGPRMDAWVAEYVLRRRIRAHSLHEACCHSHSGLLCDRSELAGFSTDMLAAWEVVAHWTTAEGHGCLHHFTVEYFAGEARWLAEIGARECGKPGAVLRLPQEGWAETAPLAICRVALLVVLANHP